MSNENRPVHLAIDLGASSGRVLAGRVLETGIELDELHRFPNGPSHQGKRLVWNLLGLWENILEGLHRAAIKYGNQIVSVGADTWGVDYVLLDGNEDIVGPCFCYRDARTLGMLDKAFARMPRPEIFANTGLQFMEINTAYQLLSMRCERSPLLDIAEQFLMVPDYIHWQLSGVKCNEFTNASTTQLLNPQTCDWSREVLDAFEIPTHIFSKPLQPGEILGPITRHVIDRTQLPVGVQVVLPATHDTGSAVLAVPADSFAPETSDWCYISCGTWSLMGVELPRPNLSDDCQKYNFTNEGGVQGSVRLLKNISGLWIVQQCREQWKREGNEYSWEQLIQMAGQAPTMVSVIDPDHSSFVAPSNMPEAIRNYCHSTGQPIPESPGSVIRCALESLALRYRVTLESLEQIVGHKINTIHMVGGGIQNRMLCQFAADACNRKVIAGPVEATAIGNIMMQAIGTGHIGSIEEARHLLLGAKDIHHYVPQLVGGRWEEGYFKLKHLTSGK